MKVENPIFHSLYHLIGVPLITQIRLLSGDTDPMRFLYPNIGDPWTDREFISDRYIDELGLDWKKLWWMSLRGKRIGDLGAGIALFAQEAKLRGINVISLDFDLWADENLPYLQSSFKTVPSIVGDMKQLPIQDETFDLLVSRGVAHDLLQSSTLRESRRVLKKGGKFIFGPGIVLPHPLNELEAIRIQELSLKSNQSESTDEEDEELKALDEKFEIGRNAWKIEASAAGCQTPEEILEYKINKSIQAISEVFPNVKVINAQRETTVSYILQK